MEESGWKNVHGDVFRPPQYPMILSSLLGSGIQLFCMILIVICELVFFFLWRWQVLHPVGFVSMATALTFSLACLFSLPFCAFFLYFAIRSIYFLSSVRSL